MKNLAAFTEHTEGYPNYISVNLDEITGMVSITTRSCHGTDHATIALKADVFTKLFSEALTNYSSALPTTAT